MGWTYEPSGAQLHRIRIVMEEITNTSGNELMNYSSSLDNTDPTAFFNKILGSECMKPHYRQAYLISYALYSIEPSATLPVLPSNLANSLIQALKPVVLDHSRTIEELAERISHVPNQVSSGWQDTEERTKAIRGMKDVKTDYFSSSANMSAWYYEAMMDVFRAHMRSYFGRSEP